MNEEYYTEKVKVRVTATMKAAFLQLKREKHKKESELAREAFVEYLAKHGITLADDAINSPHEKFVRALEKGFSERKSTRHPRAKA